MNLPEIELLQFPVEILLALAITLVLGFHIKFLLKRVNKDIPIPRPSSIDKEVWDQLTSVPGIYGGRVIGLLERILFFGSLIMGMPEFIFAWLAYKVASKWEAWSNVSKIPADFPGVNRDEWLLARTRWGSRTYQRFIIGTAANIIVAVVGLIVFHLMVFHNLFH